MTESIFTPKVCPFHQFQQKLEVIFVKVSCTHPRLSLMLFLPFLLFVFRSALSALLIQASLKLFCHLRFPSCRPNCSLQKCPLFACFCISFLPSLLPGLLAHLSRFYLYLTVVTQDCSSGTALSFLYFPEFVVGNALSNRDERI